jgi:hypothetical protein
MDAAGKGACKVKNLRKTRLFAGPDDEGDEKRRYNRFKPDLLAETCCGNYRHHEAAEAVAACRECVALSNSFVFCRIKRTRWIACCGATITES